MVTHLRTNLAVWELSKSIDKHDNNRNRNCQLDIKQQLTEELPYRRSVSKNVGHCLHRTNQECTPVECTEASCALAAAAAMNCPQTLDARLSANSKYEHQVMQAIIKTNVT